MTSNYDLIREENKQRYGTDIGRIGPMLLAERYDDRTHFIYELLQNAEDAMARRSEWQGSRSVIFELSAEELKFSHFGIPFNEEYVRGICGIAESTKNITEIGRFGIGFKSVYAITDRPEIHSGNEDFAIENFVWPISSQPVSRSADETVILLPFKAKDEQATQEIIRGLKRLGRTALLFLRQIEEVKWRSNATGQQVLYLRESKNIDELARHVTIIGQDHEMELDEKWLIFSRAVKNENECKIGQIEIAFLLTNDKKEESEVLKRIERSPLVAFFPTVVETNLGFLVQGPYRTTPSRDNVPPSDPWNQYLVKETATLLVDALRWLRDHNYLDTGTLECLPLATEKFDDSNMFKPLFEKTKAALLTEPLLPRFDRGYISANNARLGRSKEMRELFSSSQLSAIVGEDQEVVWLSGEISEGRTPILYRYLTNELKVLEYRPETIITRLDQEFLEAQPDGWILKLYEYLEGRPNLRNQLVDKPIIRLENGQHVCPTINGQFQAFLPSKSKTDFPTLRGSICSTDTAKKFLHNLGLTEPDPVDDVIRNVLPKYQTDEIDISDSDYANDIHRILSAFSTDSKSQREKLINSLRETPFLKAIDAGDGSKQILRPGEVYLATERLKELYEGVQGVFLVDNSYVCLRGENARELLEACGSSRTLKPIPTDCHLSWEKRKNIRRKEGLERCTWEGPIRDYTLRGLDSLLQYLHQLKPEGIHRKASLLWDALIDVESRVGSSAFTVTYSWSYSHESRTAEFDAAFVRRLNETAWVPNSSGEFHFPELMCFDRLGWKPSPFLQSKIRFKLPIIDTLAREAGIDPAILDLLKIHGLTNLVDLKVKLGIKDEDKQITSSSPEVGSAVAKTPSDSDRSTTHSGHSGPRSSTDKERPSTGKAGAPPFISYVGVHPDEEDSLPDPDGLEQKDRMVLEESAIAYIQSHEPDWRRTPPNTPGFDLVKVDENGEIIRWCEVKAMTGSFCDRPVGMTHTQFDYARKYGDAYWLYVVEHAKYDNANIVRIQNPARKARTFTFDQGWLSVSECDWP